MTESKEGIAKCVLKPEDFRNSGWREALEIREKRIQDEKNSEIFGFILTNGFDGLASCLEELAQKKEKKEHQHALIFLAKCLKMLLNPQDQKKPLSLGYTIEGDSVDFMPDELSDQEINCIAEFVKTVDEPFLRSRLALILWLRTEDYTYALMAIKAYMMIPLEDKIWNTGVYVSWEHALFLTQRLNEHNLHKEIVTKLIAYLSSQDNHISENQIALMLKDHIQETAESEKIAQALEASARQRKVPYAFADHDYQYASAWYAKAKNPPKQAEMLHLQAQCLEEQAGMSRGLASFFHYQNAIQALNKISGSYRDRHNVHTRLEQLENKSQKAGESMEFHKDSIEVDLSLQRGYVLNAMSKENPKEAFRVLIELPLVTTKENFYHELKERTKKSFIAKSLGGVMSPDGRQVSKTEAGEISPRIASIYNSMTIQYRVLGCILPALESLHREHKEHIPELINNTVAQSNSIPESSRNLWRKALQLGWEEDFVTAYHILIPRLEHLIRDHMKKQEITVAKTHRDKQDYVSLEKQFDNPKAQDVFGEELLFQLKWLLGNYDEYGICNARNDFAHGIFDDSIYLSDDMPVSLQNLYPVYLWWFCLRLITVYSISSKPTSS